MKTPSGGEAEIMLGSQVGRIIFGSVLILVAIGVRAIDQNNLAIVNYICGPAKSSPTCNIAEFGFITLGLGGVWTILVLVGMFYLIVYDWLLGTVKSLVSDVVDRATDIKSITIQHISKSRLSREELREIFCCCMANILGKYEESGTDFAKFVFDGIAGRECHTWRRGHNTQVSIEKLDNNRLSHKYFRYTETTTFNIVCAADSGTYPFLTESSLEATKEELSTIIDHFNYSIIYSGNRLDFDSVRDQVVIEEVCTSGGWECGAFRLCFSDQLLHVTVRYCIPVNSREISVTTDEDSLILQSDKEYAKVLNEPSKGFTFRFTAPPGHEIVGCSASVDRFEWHPGQAKGKALSTKGRKVNLNVSGWALPGIAAFVVWRCKPEYDGAVLDGERQTGRLGGEQHDYGNPASA